MTVEPTTVDFRLQRKAVKEILSKSPEGITRDELGKLAEIKGISGDDFQKVLTSLLNSGHAFYDNLEKIRYVRNE
jgi:hypothetical protein